MQIGSSSYKVHLDGYNILPYLEGKGEKSPRKEFFYFNDDGQLVAVRYESWKQVFCEQRAEGTLRSWAELFTCMRLPKLFNLCMDPYERADITSNTHCDWMVDRAFLAVPTQQYVAQFLATFKEFPPRQKAAGFSTRLDARLFLLVAALFVASAEAQQTRPNILVIFGDDVGQSNVSVYTHGLVGYKTPNIDRIAREGMMFTDYYGENSCTAGRSSFITGQSVFRTGLSIVGAPGATVGLQKEDITIAEALKPLGYAPGQFGKNHLGDRDEYLPTAHGFDEFFGNLYHLNAEEEPERPYYPKNDAAFVKGYSPRGVLHSFADGKTEDTGPLNRKRMETIDDETTNAAIDFMQRQVKAGKPFFVWMNTTRMHVFTHVRPEYTGKSGMPGNEYADGMWEHDQDVGLLLKAVDDLGIANDTVVIYTTDNGPNMFSWPDAAMSPFRSEKDSNWEGAFRVPAMIRWPGRIKPGQISNEMVSGMDWFPALLAAAGDTTVKERLLKGWQANPGGLTYKVHLDGYNILPYLEGKEPKSPRMEFFYFNDDGVLVAMRNEN